MSGKKGMSSPRYPQAMKEAIKDMVEAGKTQSEIAEHFGLKDRYVVHQILKRERRKAEAEAVIPKKKGRPFKNVPGTLAALKAENKRLKMENELMKTFLELAERE